MIWRNGVLPPNAPAFSPRLSYDLLSYGYALLGQGLRLREIGGEETSARIAFEQAATALESVIAKGSPEDPDRNFHFVLAAAAYQLAHLSARAYSLLSVIRTDENFSPIESALISMMLRDFEALDQQVLNSRASEEGGDASILDTFTEEWEALPEDGVTPDAERSFLLEGLDRALTDNFFSGMALFLFALERGDADFTAQAVTVLKEGLGVSADLNLLPQWWVHRVAIHLVKELWASSFHQKLPKRLPGGGDARWVSLRERFIAVLFRRGKAEIDLWPSQMEAAGRAIDQADNLVVSLPTSAGKTRIAELCILRCLAAGRRVVFITPLRALSAQTEVSLQRTFAPLGVKISTLYGSIGVSSVDTDTMHVSDIVVATPEKLDFAIRNDASLLDDVGLLVFDEGHMIGLEEREVRYEVQIQRLLRRPDAATRRIVCLSAILPSGEQLDDFAAWLTRDQPGGVVRSEWRPTRLRFGEVIWGGNQARLNLRVGDERPFVPSFLTAFRPPIGRRQALFPKDQNELCLATAWRLVEDGQTVLLFCPMRKSVEPFAMRVVELHARGALRSLLAVDPEKLRTAITLGREWLGADHPILACLKLGVAIHHGALPSAFRKEIERLLRDGVLKVTISSPTLAQGLNLSATAVVFHSLHRSGEVLKVSDFKNIVGRAGRAFIDVEGVVLFPVFDQREHRLLIWETLIGDLGAREMESGLFQLVLTLLLRMQRKLGDNSLAVLAEYVTNNAVAWDFPVIAGENAQVAMEEARRWEGFITMLDTAVLSMLGETEVADADIEETLDNALSSSLWQRRLARLDAAVGDVMRAALVARSRYVWTNSTAAKRRGYFLAGIGLKAGHALDAIAPDANQELVTANGAIVEGEQDVAIETITALADRVFAIPPFAPDSTPTNWKAILAAWLRGTPLADVAEGQEAETLQFVEGALVYRLPWAMEALRVRGLANQDRIGDFALEDFDLSAAVAAVETGTLNRSASILMRAGFGSRIAAIKAVVDTGATFSNYAELREWLRSERVAEREAAADWPTPETAEMWTDFRGSVRPVETKLWEERLYSADVRWAPDKERPEPGSSIRVYSDPDDVHLILSPNGDPLGEMGNYINPHRTGLLHAAVLEDGQRISLRYFGPDDFVD